MLACCDRVATAPEPAPRTDAPCAQLVDRYADRTGRLLVLPTVAVAVAVAVLTIALFYVQPFAGWMNFVTLPLPILIASLVIVALFVAATEIAKRRFYAGNAERT